MYVYNANTFSSLIVCYLSSCVQALPKHFSEKDGSAAKKKIARAPMPLPVWTRKPS